MFEQYFGLDLKRATYYLGLIIAALLIVTLIYWLVYGFDRWSGQMQRASDLMTAAVGPPVVQANPGPAVAQANPGPAGAGQYVCPQDGAVGLPHLDGNGVPHCPVCGQVMHFNRAPSANLTLAAGAG